jgi:hypothetical protein
MITSVWSRTRPREEQAQKLYPLADFWTTLRPRRIASRWPVIQHIVKVTCLDLAFHEDRARGGKPSISNCSVHAPNNTSGVAIMVRSEIRRNGRLGKELRVGFRHCHRRAP